MNEKQKEREIFNYYVINHVTKKKIQTTSKYKKIKINVLYFISFFLVKYFLSKKSSKPTYVTHVSVS